jgi:hypothetical protein
MALKGTKGRGKGEVHPRTGHKGPEGEQMYSPTVPSTLVLDGGWVVNAIYATLPPGKTWYPTCIGGWVGPTASLDGCRKSRPPPTELSRPLLKGMELRQILAEAGVFSCFQIVQNGSCDSACLLCNGYLGYLRALKKLRHEVENSLPSSDEVKVNSTTPLFFLYTFMTCTGGNFPLLSFYLI